MEESLLGISRHSLAQSDERNQWCVYMVGAGWGALLRVTLLLEFWLSSLILTQYRWPPCVCCLSRQAYLYIPHPPNLEGSADLEIMCPIPFWKTRDTQKPQLSS